MSAMPDRRVHPMFRTHTPIPDLPAIGVLPGRVIAQSTTPAMRNFEWNEMTFPGKHLLPPIPTFSHRLPRGR